MRQRWTERMQNKLTNMSSEIEPTGESQSLGAWEWNAQSGYVTCTDEILHMLRESFNNEKTLIGGFLRADSTNLVQQLFSCYNIANFPHFIVFP